MATKLAEGSSEIPDINFDLFAPGIPNVNDPSGSGNPVWTVTGNGDISQSDPNRTVLQDVFGERSDGSLIGHPLNDFPFDITTSYKLTLLGWAVVGGIGLLVLSFFRKGR